MEGRNVWLQRANAKLDSVVVKWDRHGSCERVRGRRMLVEKNGCDQNEGEKYCGSICH